MYGMMGKLTAQTGQREALLNILMKSSNESAGMEGCYVYIISAATDDANVIWITEVWRDKAAHDASLQNENVRAVITEARPLIAAPPEGFEIIPYGGIGLPKNTE